jgi:hypothetical protein
MLDADKTGQLADALRAAGMAPDAANRVAQILGAIGVSEKVSPQQVDTTPQSMRYVTRGVRKHELTNFDYRDDDPYYRKPRGNTSENRTRPEQPSTLRTPQAPQQTETPFNVSGGSFTTSVTRGDQIAVGLNIKGPDRSIATVDGTSNAIIGKRVRAETDASGLRFFVEENAQELVWKLQFFASGSEGLWVVTDVALTDRGLVIKKRRIAALDDGEEEETVISTVSC